MYASLNNHAGGEFGRRDDLESIAYMLIYFLKGALPWVVYGANGKPTLLLEQKINLKIDALCSDIPKEFAKFLQYSRSLGFEQEPDYELCKSWFKDLYNAQNYGNVDPSQQPYWDWDEKDDDDDDDDDDDNEKCVEPALTNVFNFAGDGNEKCVEPAATNSSSMDVVNQGSSVTAEDDIPKL